MDRKLSFEEIISGIILTGGLTLVGLVYLFEGRRIHKKTKNEASSQIYGFVGACRTHIENPPEYPIPKRYGKYPTAYGLKCNEFDCYD